MKMTTVKTETGTMTLLPPKADKCQECAVDHKPEDPHNAQSLYYHVNFKMKNGRDPSWLDAYAHCTDEMKNHWRTHLMQMGVDVDGGKINPTKAKK